MRGGFIGIMVDESSTLLTGLLGILKSGNCFVPIDPTYPKDRIDFISNDCNIRLLLTDKPNYNRAVEFARNNLSIKRIICIDKAIEDMQAKIKRRQPRRPALSKDHPCYIIYTSGSTGKPKGVIITHGNLVPLFSWFRDFFGLGKHSKILQTLSYTFDFGVFEIFTTIIFGGTIYFLNLKGIDDLMEYVDFIIENQINTIHTTPSFFHSIASLGRKMPTLKTIHFGGEKLTVKMIEDVSRLLAGEYKIYNGYGPTETTINASIFTVTEEVKSYIRSIDAVPIGKPTADNFIYILDQHRNLLPLGIPGEICIGGGGVAWGYLNRPDLSNDNFIHNPYRPGDMLYCTGDLGCWLADGNINYLGRIDDQVKIRGFRIELGEIENRLLKHEAIKEAVVVVRVDSKGDKYLCAYYIESLSGDYSSSQRQTSELREYLAKELPDYMIPSFFVQMEKMPLSSSGKVNKKALPEPVLETEVGYVEPQDELEKRIQNIWQEVLELERIGTYDNFFEIGGHSLRIIQVLNAIRQELGAKIAIAEVFRHPTIKELAAVIKGAETEAHSPIEPIEKKEYYEVSHSQKRVWVICQFEGGSAAFNMPGAYLLEGILDKGAFEKVFNTLVERHESLRTLFISIDGEPKQRISSVEESGFRIEGIDFGEAQDREAKVLQLANAEEDILFDFTRGPLLRIKLIKLEEEKHLFLFTMHHIISDALSMEVLLSEMLTLYEAFSQGKKNPLLPLRIQYKDFANWHNRELGGKKAEKWGPFWLDQLNGELPVLELPTDKARPEVMSYSGDTVSFHLDEDLTGKLRELSNQNDATLFMTLLAALNVFLYGYTAQTDIIIGTTLLGREHKDLHNQIGFYLNTLPLRTRFNPHDTFIDLLFKTREVALAAYEHQGYPFDKLVEDLGVERDISRHPVFGVLLNMINYDLSQTNTSSGSGSLKITPFEAGYHKTKFDLTIYVYERETTLTVVFEYNVDLFENRTILMMLKRFRDLIDIIVENTSSVVTDLLLKDQINLLPISPMTHISSEVSRFNASYHQERLWFIDEFEAGHLYEDSPIYHNIPFILKVKGPLDTVALGKSIQAVIQRHSALRTRIVAINNKPVQLVEPRLEFELHLLNLEKVSGSYAEALVLAVNESKRPFRLDKEPLIRSTLIQWGPQDFILLITLHHINTDKKSLEIFAREMALFYESLSNNKTPQLPDLPLQYTDFSRWQSEFPLETLDTLFFYWKRKLHGKLQALEIPTDRPRARVHTFHEERQEFTLSQDLTGQIQEYIRQEGVDIFVFLLAAVKVLLHIYCAQDEILVGTSVSNRNNTGTAGMIGPVANLLVLRSHLTGNDIFQKVIKDVSQTLKEAFKYQDMPFDLLVSALNPEIDMSRTALFDVLFQYEETPFLGAYMGDVTIEAIETNLGWGKYDLNFLIQKKADEQGEFFAGVLVYNANYYDDSRLSRLIGHYQVLVENILSNPHQQVSRVDILTQREKQLLLWDWNGKPAHYPQNLDIAQLFEIQAAKTPDHIVVIGSRSADLAVKCESLYTSSDQVSLTYRQVKDKVSQLAQLLIEKGIRLDCLVAVLAERSVEMIFGILGILKAGGAYLPIDPNYPAERNRYILADSGAKMLITGAGLFINNRNSNDQNHTTSRSFLNFGNLNFEFISSLDFLASDLSSGPKRAVLLEPAADYRQLATCLAYVIYTSGTTGRPKGVLVEHRSVVSLLFSDGFQFDFNDSDIWTMFHSPCFDFSLWEIFGSLLYGGQLIVIPRRIARDTEQYVSIIRCHQVTILNQTPSAFYQFMDVALDQVKSDLCIRYVIFGGEALHPGKLKRWQARYPQTRLINMFGITETTVHVTYKEITDKEIDLNVGNIGKPLPTLTSYIMNKNQRLLPVGITGELFVGGAGVSRGYLNRVELTAQRFLDNPYKGGEILYRSGDQVRCFENGEMVYMGRIDHQVQLRGFRVEPGEIENQILKYPTVKEAVVIDRKDESGDKYLYAYVVAPSMEHGAIGEDLREFLSHTLPDYMIPSYFVKINKIPLTVHGKLDRKALPEPEFKKAAPDRTIPLDPVQQKLVRIWSEVLNIEKENIDINTNFFEMGGHSLKAAQLVSRLHKEFDVKLPLEQVFTNPTIKELAEPIRSFKRELFVSVQPAEEKEYYPLSSAQKRLFVLQQLEFTGTGYNMPQAFTLNLGTGTDLEKLEGTFRKLVQRHDNLKTFFELIESEPVQRIHDRVEFRIEYYTGVGVTSDLQPETNLLVSFIRPFDLSNAPLLRVGVAPLTAEEYLLLIDMHHIVTDAVSQQVLVGDFWSLILEDELPPLKLNYKDYCEWQNEKRIKAMVMQQRDYWLTEFSGEIPVLNLPCDDARPAIQSFAGSTRNFKLEVCETDALKALAKEANATLYMVILAIFNILLAKLSGQEDIIVGTPVAGRKHADLEHIIGMFVTTLALRNYPVDQKTFSEFLDQLKKRTLEAFENQDYPFEELVEHLVVERDASRNPLFDVMFIYQDTAPGKAARQELQVKPYPYHPNTSKFDITLSTQESGEGLLFNLEYCTKLFREETIARFIEYFKKIASIILENPGEKISGIVIISEEKKRQILSDFNAAESPYPEGKTLHQVFEEQVAQTPDHTALEERRMEPTDVPRTISYRVLNHSANRLAHLLRERGLQPETVVGLIREPSLWLLVGVLGILKAGGAYLPMDSGYPIERIAYMLADGGARLLLTTPNLFKEAREVGKWKGDTIFIEQSAEQITQDTLHLPPASATSPAYVIYTSGSTGKPKGVMVEHRSAVNLLTALFKMYPMTQTDAYLLKTSFVFDVSVTELFGWYWDGSRLGILGEEERKDPWKIITAIESLKITHVNFVPALFGAFIQALDEQNISRLSTLKYIFLAGEALLPELVNKFRRFDTHIVLENLYGPTEGTVYASGYSLSRWTGRGNIPIGKPLPNVVLYILNRNYHLQPAGVTGELCVGGSGLARGYLNQPELTAERFASTKHIEHSAERYLSTVMSGDLHSALCDYMERSGTRLYRTGDLARWLADGNVEFLGRIDQQVKIRGFRVELAEIENQLLNQAEIREAAVILRAREADEEDKYLCGYYVSNKKLAASELQEYLAKQLPDYMIPAFFVWLEKFPLTPTGKIDRWALPAPEMEAGLHYTAPRNSLEEKLTEIWTQVLGISPGVIGIDDIFFRLGGHSLKATLMAARIHKALNVRLPLSEVFKTPSIRGLAEYIRRLIKDRYASINPIEKKEYYLLSSAQKRLYILQQMSPASTAYNMPEIISLHQAPDVEQLTATFKRLMERHESLRTSFVIVDEEPMQRVHEKVELEIEYYHIGNRHQAPDINDDNVSNFNFLRPFDLSTAPLLHVGLIKSADDQHILMVDMHHIITDGTSQNILKEEFMTLYSGDELSHLQIQYKDFAEWQNAEEQRRFIVKQESYWLKEFFPGEGLPVLDLPIDYPRPLMQSFLGRSVNFLLNEQETQKLKRLAGEIDATLYMTVLSVYTILLSKLSGQEDIIVGTPTAGRRHADLERIIGMFVNTLAMRNYPESLKTFMEFINQVKDRTAEAFENQDYPFETLVDHLSLPKDTSRNPIFDVMINVLNQSDYPESIPDLSEIEEEKLYQHMRGASKFDINLRIFDYGDKLLCNLEYCTSLFKPATIERMIDYFKRIIAFVTEKPGKKIKEIEIISPQRKREILAQFNRELEEALDVDIFQYILLEALERYENHTAVEYGTVQVTYSQLDKKSTLMSRRLHHEGIEIGSFIGIYLDDRIDLISSMVCILKARCLFIPLDTALPVKRIEQMIQITNPPLIFTTPFYRERLISNSRDIDLTSKFVDVDPLFEKEAALLPSIALRNDYQGDDKIYIYFTSGSTGIPKGIVGKNRSLLQFVHWEIDTFGITPGFRVSQLAAPGFDAFLRNVFSPLCAGGVVCIPKNRELVMDSGSLIDWINRNRIHLIHCVPAVFWLFNTISLTPRHFKELKYVLLSGDIVNPHELVNWYENFDDRIQLVNCYGATETTLIRTYYFIQRSDSQEDRISVGKPMKGTSAIILDENLNVCDQGLVGEIYIRTPYSTWGYFDDPQLNREKFIPNPFGEDPSDLVYRSGDLGRLMENGNIEFLRRKDAQVKIRGIRIELGEIENRLRKYKHIRAAVAAVKEVAGENHICAYIISDIEISPSELRTYLAHELPDYMIPSSFMSIDKIPLTPHGKIDRKKLPKPEITAKKVYTAPRDALERNMAEIWSEVLGTDIGIGIDDNFFELGGHSLKATRIAAKIHEELAVKLPLAEIFRSPTIRELSAVAVKIGKTVHLDIEAVEEKEFYELSYSQRRIWDIKQANPDDISYNTPSQIVFDHEVDEEIIKKVIGRLMERHESLRTSFRQVEGQPVQVIEKYDNLYVPLQVIDISSLEESEKQHERKRIFDQEARTPFDISRAPLFSSLLVKWGPGHSDFIYNTYHIIADAWAHEVLRQDFLALYQCFKVGKEVELEPLAVRYRDFAVWQARQLSDRTVNEKAHHYWKSKLEQGFPPLQLPFDFLASADEHDNKSFTYRTVIDMELKQRLKKLGANNHTSLFMVMFSAINLLFSRLVNQKDIVLRIPTSGRDHVSLHPVVGRFTNPIFIRNRLEEKADKNFIDVLHRVNGCTLEALQHQWYPLELILEELQMEYPDFIVSFNMLNMYEGTAARDLDNFDSFHRERVTGEVFPITVQILEYRNAVEIIWSYQQKFFKPAAIEDMAGRFKEMLNEITLTVR